MYMYYYTKSATLTLTQHTTTFATLTQYTSCTITWYYMCTCTYIQYTYWQCIMLRVRSQHHQSVHVAILHSGVDH